LATLSYPCIQCGRPTRSIDRYVVCDTCLEELEQSFEDGPDATRLVSDGRAPLSGDGPRAPDEVEASLRRLLDDW
jgi:hypothetical protein